MKNMKLLVIALLLCFTFIPAVSAQAASYYSGQVTDARQIEAGNNYVTLTWSPVSGAKYYVITAYDSSYNEVIIARTASTTYKITGLQNNVTDNVYVYPVGTVDDGSEDYGYRSGSVKIATTPSQVTNFDLYRWYPHKKVSYNKTNVNKVWLKWDVNYYADGYEIEIYSLKDKKLKTYKTTSSSSYDFTLKSIKNKGFKMRIRSYVTCDNKNYYSDWTSKKVVIPQATILSTSGRTTRTVKWAKVTGAKSYTVYKTTNGGKSYKKVKTVGKNTTKYSIKKMQTGSQYGVAIVANVKVGKKTYKSPITYYVYAY